MSKSSANRNPPPRQWSVRTLFVATTIAAVYVGCVVWVWQLDEMTDAFNPAKVHWTLGLLWLGAAMLSPALLAATGALMFYYRPAPISLDTLVVLAACLIGLLSAQDYWKSLEFAKEATLAVCVMIVYLPLVGFVEAYARKFYIHLITCSCAFVLAMTVCPLALRMQ